MKIHNSPKNIKLRQKAEERLENLKSNSDLNLQEYDILKLVHELQVHQIELEMQKDEISQAKENADILAEKYIELYNLAPLGYFTLTKEGQIIELNHFGSLMLQQHAVLEKSNFGFYVIDDDKPILTLFLEKIFNAKFTETCIVSMSLKQNFIKHVLLTGNISKKSEHCLIAAIDISDRIELEKESNELKQFNEYFVGRELKMVELKKEINELLHRNGYANKYPV